MDTETLGQPWVSFGQTTLSQADVLAYGIVALVVLGAILMAILVLSLINRGRRTAEAEAQARELEIRLSELTRSQAEMTGRMQTMAEVFGSRQADLAQGLQQHLDGFGERLTSTTSTQARATHDSLSKLSERLAVIDAAQKNITELSREVVSLQDILADKQQRGAFGQGRMESIIADGLPSDAYSFQATLSNDKRPDCLIRMPNAAPGLVVDAKFPLESVRAFRDAEQAEARKSAAQLLRSAMMKHIQDIAERYFIPGETQDIALMFVPSEAIYADLHEHFDDVVQKALRKRVVLVGPNMLMLAVQTILALLRDQRMRDQAHVIQKEVTMLTTDVGRLHERILALQKHFGLANKDIGQIVTSVEKISRRGERIEQLDLGEEDGANSAQPRLVGNAAE